MIIIVKIIFFRFGEILLHSLITGFLLSAILAAIMIVSLLTKAPEGKIAEQFDLFKASL
jgi:sodium/proline symporter